MGKDKEADDDKNKPFTWLQAILWRIHWAKLFLFGMPRSELMRHAREGTLKIADPPKRLLSAPNEEWLPQDLDTELQCLVLMDRLR